jgi:hypothetical protein
MAITFRTTQNKDAVRTAAKCIQNMFSIDFSTANDGYPVFYGRSYGAFIAQITPTEFTGKADDLWFRVCL